MTQMEAKIKLKQNDGVNPIVFFLRLKKCFVTIPLVDDLILLWDCIFLRRTLHYFWYSIYQILTPTIHSNSHYLLITKMDSDIVRYFLYHKNVLIHLEMIVTTKELDIFRFQYLQIAAYHKLSKRQSMPNDGFICFV